MLTSYSSMSFIVLFMIYTVITFPTTFQVAKPFIYRGVRLFYCISAFITVTMLFSRNNCAPKLIIIAFVVIVYIATDRAFNRHPFACFKIIPPMFHLLSPLRLYRSSIMSSRSSYHLRRLLLSTSTPMQIPMSKDHTATITNVINNPVFIRCQPLSPCRNTCTPTD